MVWWSVVWFVASLVVSYALRPKQTQTKISPGDIETQTADEGIPVPVLFGTRVINNSNIVWYGDVKTVAIKQGGGKK